MNKHLKQLSQFPKNLRYSALASPVGDLLILANADGICAIMWQSSLNDEEKRYIELHFEQDHHFKWIVEAKAQLKDYFARERSTFDLPLVPTGSNFQQQAWAQLRQIPYGQTISYGEQARRLGDKNKARAVGMANGMNSISIVVPCHRVIGADGSLTGFGGGLENKRLLLALEKQNA